MKNRTHENSFRWSNKLPRHHNRTTTWYLNYVETTAINNHIFGTVSKYSHICRTRYGHLILKLCLYCGMRPWPKTPQSQTCPSAARGGKTHCALGSHIATEDWRLPLDGLSSTPRNVCSISD